MLDLNLLAKNTEGISRLLPINMHKPHPLKAKSSRACTAQNASAEVLPEIDEKLVTLEQRRHMTRALKQAMMQMLLNGRT